MITWGMYQRCLFTVTLVSLRNVLAESQFTDFTSRNSFTWNLWKENRRWSGSSREQHIHTLLHLEDFLVSETSFVLSFFISCKAALSQVLYFNKVPSVFFFCCCGNLAGGSQTDLTGLLYHCNGFLLTDRQTDSYLSCLTAWIVRSRGISSTASGRFLSRRSGR